MNLSRTLAPKWMAAVVAIAALASLAACASKVTRGVAKPAPAESPAPVAPPASRYPIAAPRTQTRDWAGIGVSDDFAWLENAADPATRDWVAAEDADSRRALDAMPVRAALHQRLQALIGSTTNEVSALVERGGVVFALKTAVPQRRPVLVAMKSVDDVAGERVVFDPNEAFSDGSDALEFFRPSLDGRKVALGLSSRGGVVLRVVDVGTGQLLPDEIPAAAGGDVAWSVGSARRLHRRGRVPRQARRHAAVPAGPPRPRRRCAGGRRGADAAARSVPRGGPRRWTLRPAGLRA